ncbi:MAG: hypothetical protein H8E59_06610 [Actinobacteria bacterium]|nr:hypothetical protein [Actinomycetota bacterium]
MGDRYRPPAGASGALTRLALVVVGQVCFGIGIGLLFLAELGVGPWDVLHDGLAERIGWAPGTVIVGIGVLLLVLLVLFRQPIGPATVTNVVIIGGAVNLVLDTFETPSSVAVQVALVATAPILVALGSMVYLGAGIGVGPRDGLMTALVDAGLTTRTARTLLEVTVLVGGLALGGSVGVGTVVFALVVGPSLHRLQDRVWPGWSEPPGWVFRRG